MCAHGGFNALVVCYLAALVVGYCWVGIGELFLLVAKWIGVVKEL